VRTFLKDELEILSGSAATSWPWWSVCFRTPWKTSLNGSAGLERSDFRWIDLDSGIIGASSGPLALSVMTPAAKPSVISPLC
jgi:hypothetical protein